MVIMYDKNVHGRAFLSRKVITTNILALAKLPTIEYRNIADTNVFLLRFCTFCYDLCSLTKSHFLRSVITNKITMLTFIIICMLY